MDPLGTVMYHLHCTSLGYWTGKPGDEKFPDGPISGPPQSTDNKKDPFLRSKFFSEAVLNHGPAWMYHAVLYLTITRTFRETFPRLLSKSLFSIHLRTSFYATKMLAFGGRALCNGIVRLNFLA